MPLQFQSATILTKQQLSSNFFLLRCHPHRSLEFQPGQYLIVRVNPDRVVQYSFASPPRRDEFELLIQYIPGGQASEWIKNDLQIGDTIKYLGPLGIFTYHPDDGALQLLFLATGSGIAPFKSIPDNLLLNHQESRPIHLYLGLRYFHDIIYQQHFTQLMNQFSNFKFSLYLSRPDDQWLGQCGHITAGLHQDYTDTSTAAAYLCGSGSMITEATDILAELGTHPTRIYTEKFW